MGKSQEYKVFGILCLLVSIVAVSFAYSALTHTLNIKVSDNNNSNEKWEIVFDNLSNANTIGSATEVNSPNITAATTLADFETTFYSPGDAISYTFDVENNGTLDAMVSSIQITTPSCIGNDSDCSKALKYVKYTLTYDDGSEITPGDILYSRNNSFFGNSNKKLKLSLAYSKNIDTMDLPKNDVVLKDIEAVILYEQIQVG